MDMMDTNLMLCMDMIAMQNMMAQQQRDMHYGSQYQSKQSLYNGKEDKSYQKFAKKDINDVQDNHYVDESGHIQPLRDISAVQTSSYDTIEKYDSKGQCVLYCGCKEEDDSLVIECFVPKGMMSEEQFERWLLKQIKTANDRYVKKLKFHISKEDEVAIKIVSKYAKI